jgi:predicted 3-demethylubiquinone-9 3-methyltransferase (glyoxalase superfamily)
MSKRARRHRLLGVSTRFSLLSGAVALLGAVATFLPFQDPKSPTPMPTATAQKITTFLWFDDDAEEAIRFYGSLFPDAKVLEQSRWGEGGPLPKGTLMAATFQLAGQQFMALNGGPRYRFNEAISLFVACEDQREIDRLWAALTADGGEPGRCGWLKDKYGLSWQLAPRSLAAMLADPDPAKARAVGAAMMQMDKLDLAKLRAAHAGK